MTKRKKSLPKQTGKPKPIKATLLTPNEQKERASQIKQNQAEFEKEHKRHEKYLSQLPCPTSESIETMFRTIAESIDKELNRLNYNSNNPEFIRLERNYKRAIQGIIKQAEHHLANYPDFGEIPSLSGANYDRVAVMTARVEFCEHAAELLEASTTKVKRQPLTKKARIIRNMLKSLPEGEARTRKEILDWLSKLEEPIYMDEGTFNKIRKELIPYGLKNKPRVGYYFQKINS